MVLLEASPTTTILRLDKLSKTQVASLLTLLVRFKTETMLPLSTRLALQLEQLLVETQD